MSGNATVDLVSKIVELNKRLQTIADDTPLGDSGFSIGQEVFFQKWITFADGGAQRWSRGYLIGVDEFVVGGGRIMYNLEILPQLNTGKLGRTITKTLGLERVITRKEWDAKQEMGGGID